MNREKLQKPAALRIAKGMKDRLLAQGVPVEQVYLFGSVAKGNLHRWSDIDLAFVCRPFGADRTEEYAKIASTREDFDIPMDIVLLHPEDFDQPFFTLGREIERTGVEV